MSRVAFAVIVAVLALSASCRSAPSFYRLEKRGEAWWFVSPDGDAIVSLGVNHIEPVLLASENNRAIFEKKYGVDILGPDGKGDPFSPGAAKWMEDSVALIRSWGFNTVGVHNPIPQRKLPYVAKFRPAPIDGWAGLDRKYADPFDPDTAERLRGAAAAWCARNAADPLILGISFNDMPIWRAAPGAIHEWVRYIMGLGPDAPGKRRWVAVLERNYPGPAAAGLSYGVETSSWQDLLERTEWDPPRGSWRVFKDVNAFLPEIADAWYGAMTAAIRSCDSNHLVFGDKLEGALDMPSWIYPIVGRHFDLAYIQWYADAGDQRAKLAELYAATGKPVLLGDSSFSHPNDNVRRPKGIHVRSEKAVGRRYARYLEAMMRTPYVVGWHFCGFIEGSPDLAKHHPYFAIQSGFLKPDGTPYVKTLENVVKANRRAEAWHRSAVRDPLPIWRAGDLAKAGARRCRHADVKAFSFTRIDDNVFDLERIATPNSGAPNKNIGWVVTDEGVVVVDAGMPSSAIAAKAVIRATTDEPIKYIIYTHHHGTQIGGAYELQEPGTQIIAHEDLPLALDTIRKQYRFNALLNAIQFDKPFAGDRAQSPRFRYPDITYKDVYAFTLGGTRFELRHVVGESDDYTVVLLPEQKIAWTGDLVGPSVPLVGSPMKIVRDDVKWRKGLEMIRAFEPEVLVGAVGPPMCDPQAIDAKLDANIEYLGFLNDAVSAELNAGSTLEEALAHIRVPEELRRNPWLGGERYGNLEFNVRGLFSRYGGWFDRDGSSLDPAPSAAKAKSFIDDMGGREKARARAAALERLGDPQLALEYVDLLIESEGGDADARLAKARLLRALAFEHIDNPLMANMLRRLAAMQEEAAASPRQEP